MTNIGGRALVWSDLEAHKSRARGSHERDPGQAHKGLAAVQRVRWDQCQDVFSTYRPVKPHTQSVILANLNTFFEHQIKARSRLPRWRAAHSETRFLISPSYLYWCETCLGTHIHPSTKHVSARLGFARLRSARRGMGWACGWPPLSLKS